MQKQSSATVQEDLDELRAKHRKQSKDFRHWRYDMLATAMKIVVSLRDDEGRHPKSIQQTQKRLASSALGSSSLSATVLAYVTNAKSPNALKLVWKWARVVEYLHDHAKVPVAHLAREIKVRGGIEYLASKAAKETPLRRAKSMGESRAAPSKSRSAHLLCRVTPMTAKKLRSIRTGATVKLFGVRTGVRGLTPGAIVDVRKVVAVRSQGN